MNFTEQRRLALLGRLRERFPTWQEGCLLTIDVKRLTWAGTNLQRVYLGIDIGGECFLLIQVREETLESAEACQAFESQVVALIETTLRYHVPSRPRHGLRSQSGL